MSGQRKKPTTPIPSPLHLWCSRCETWKLPEEFYACGSWCVLCRRSASNARAKRIRDALPPKQAKPRPGRPSKPSKLGIEASPLEEALPPPPVVVEPVLTAVDLEYYRDLFPDDDWS